MYIIRVLWGNMFWFCVCLLLSGLIWGPDVLSTDEIFFGLKTCVMYTIWLRLDATHVEPKIMSGLLVRAVKWLEIFGSSKVRINRKYVRSDK